MVNLRNIREDQVRVAEIYNIVSSLQLVSITHMRQFTRRKKLYESILLEVENTFKQFHHKYNYNQNYDLHIILSCDQKFCRGLIKSINNHILNFPFTEESKIIMFGSRSRKIIASKVKNKNICEYKTIKTISDCERIALEIMKDYPKTTIHYYNGHEYTHLKLLPFPEHKHKRNNVPLLECDVDTMAHLYLTSKIYMASLETGLKENTDSAIVMSEAAENAENSSKELRRAYNKIRQSIVTKEVVMAN